VVPWWPIWCRRQIALRPVVMLANWTLFQTNHLIDCIDSVVKLLSNPNCFPHCQHRLSGFCRGIQHWILHAMTKA
jgi:hypothetical protein